MSFRTTIRFEDQLAESINELVKTGKADNFSDAVRQLCKRGLGITFTDDNIDFINEMTRKNLEAIIEPQIERIVKLVVKSGIMSASSVYLNAEAFANLVPEHKQKDVQDLYIRARKKGIKYIRHNISDIELMKDDL